MYAIIELNSHQYKIYQGDILKVDNLDLPMNTQICAKKVLLLSTANHTIIGRPSVNSAKVILKIMGTELSNKIVGKKRLSKHLSSQSHRSKISLIYVVDIQASN